MVVGDQWGLVKLPYNQLLQSEPLKKRVQGAIPPLLGLQWDWVDSGEAWTITAECHSGIGVSTVVLTRREVEWLGLHTNCLYQCQVYS